MSFDNGDTQEMNTENYCYSVGDRFTGTLYWNPISGISGTAYSWHPPEWQLIFTIGATLFNLLLCLALVGGFIWYAFGSNDKKVGELE